MNSGYRFVCITLLVFGISGCSSVLTYLGPVKTEIVDGESYKGDIVEYDYNLTAENDRLHFTKSPLCKKIVQKVAVSKKEQRGYSLALLEMPLFGLGLFDMLRAHAIVEDSRRVEPLEKKFDGELVFCHGSQPASNETFIIKDEARSFEISARTDNEGIIDLKTLIPETVEAAGLEIRPGAKPSDVMFHAYPAEVFSP